MPTILNQTEITTANAMWALISQADENVQKELYIRLRDKHYDTLPKQVVYQNTSVEHIHKRLAELSQLEYGWDGIKAEKIEPHVIANLEAVLQNDGSEEIWSKWVLYPDSNGTITLMSRDKNASISVGRDEYSFVSMREGHEASANHVPFVADRFVEDIKRIG